MSLNLFSDDVDAETTAELISYTLMRLHSTTDAYVHYQTISFPDTNTRESWGKLVDKDYRGIYRELWEEPFNIVKIAHFSDPIITWSQANTIHDGEAEWNRVPWHHWTAALIKHSSGYGIYLVIYDNDPRMASDGDRCTDVLSHEQRTLWEFFKNRGLVRVYYYVDDSESDAALSLPVSMRRARLLAAYGDSELGVDEEDNDPRLQDCVVLRDS